MEYNSPMPDVIKKTSSTVVPVSNQNGTETSFFWQAGPPQYVVLRLVSMPFPSIVLTSASHEQAKQTGAVLDSLLTDLQVPWPEQAVHTPQQAETVVDQAGQLIKRQLFRALLVQADAELIVHQRAGLQGQGIQQRGTAQMGGRRATRPASAGRPRQHVTHAVAVRSIELSRLQSNKAPTHAPV